MALVLKLTFDRLERNSEAYNQLQRATYQHADVLEPTYGADYFIVWNTRFIAKEPCLGTSHYLIIIQV